MIVIPAIDLLKGEAVRLFKGDYATKTVYSTKPYELAKRFEDMGAQFLHVVDLDGAKNGNTANLEAIKKIRAATKMPIEVGGGIRDEAAVELYLDKIGIDRVILGTAALENTAFLRLMLDKYGAKRIVVGVDVRNEMVSVGGWLSQSGTHYLEFIERLKGFAVEYVIVTDISKDGTLSGPNWKMYESINGINVVVSGGVSCDEDIEKAKTYYGVIVGKAYYEKKVDLEKWLQKE